MVEELQLTFKGYHQLNEMSPGHESTISTNFEKSDETLHIHIYIYYSLFLFFFSTFVPLLTPSSDKTLPTRGSEVYCKKRTSRRVNESILEPPPSLPSQTDHPLPLKNALREREVEERST